MTFEEVAQWIEAFNETEEAAKQDEELREAIEQTRSGA